MTNELPSALFAVLSQEKWLWPSQSTLCGYQTKPVYWKNHFCSIRKKDGTQMRLNKGIFIVIPNNTVWQLRRFISAEVDTNPLMCPNVTLSGFQISSDFCTTHAALNWWKTITTKNMLEAYLVVWNDRLKKHIACTEAGRGFNIFRFSLCRLQNLDAAVCCLSKSPEDGDHLRKWNIHELRPAGIPHSGVKVLKTQKVYKQKLFSIHKNELNTETRDSSVEVTILNV